MNATELLDRHYLEVRARLLEIAATLDRIDRGDGNTAEDPPAQDPPAQDPRMQQIHEGLRILLSSPAGGSGGSGNRAERIQHLFSRPYQADWRQSLDV